MNTFTFSGFTLRPAEGLDLALAREWSEADPAHRGTPAEFWIAQSLDVKSFLLSDAEGPVFFFRMRAFFGNPGRIQVWMQFEPESVVKVSDRTRSGLRCGFSWFEQKMAGMGFGAVYFDTKNPNLVRFCRKLGFINTGRRNLQGGMVLKRWLQARAA